MDLMKLESGALKEDKILSVEEDDKKFVSQAVAFVIGHTRNGFVALCASVATLLKEQTRLKLENESLKQQISLLKSPPSHTHIETRDKQLISLTVEQNSVSKYTNTTYDALCQHRFKRKAFQKKPYKALKGCLCNSCTRENYSDAITPPLKMGVKVVISGEICGIVSYIGHIESLQFPEIFIGLYLDEAVGDSNGTIGRKTYFTAPQGFGLFVPLLSVLCVIN